MSSQLSRPCFRRSLSFKAGQEDKDKLQKTRTRARERGAPWALLRHARRNSQSQRFAVDLLEILLQSACVAEAPRAFMERARDRLVRSEPESFYFYSKCLPVCGYPLLKTILILTESERQGLISGISLDGHQGVPSPQEIEGRTIQTRRSCTLYDTR